MNQQLDRGCDLPTECRFAAGVAGKSRQQLHAVNGIARGVGVPRRHRAIMRSEEHTSELQSLMRISYAVFCLKKKTTNKALKSTYQTNTAQTKPKKMKA